MAIVLPYPDLVFVPLDKLTAEEMNQIVANYTAIADSAGKSGFYDGETNIAKTPTANQDIVTVDITDAAVGANILLIGQAKVASALGGYNGTMTVGIYYNGAFQGGTQANDPEAITSVINFVNKITKVAGQNTVSLRAQLVTGTPQANNFYLGALVVG